jgi:hypothetical protein
VMLFIMHNNRLRRITLHINCRNEDNYNEYDASLQAEFESRFLCNAKHFGLFRTVQ